MNKYYISTIILIVIILSIILWFYKNNLKTNQNSMAPKAYALNDATLNTGTMEIIYKNNPPGVSHLLFVVVLGEGKYLVTKFSWPVIPEPTPEQEPGSTYIFENGKFTPTNESLKYTPSTGVLAGTVNGVVLDVNQANTYPGRGTEYFKEVQKLPGLEKIVYKEIK